MLTMLKLVLDFWIKIPRWEKQHIQNLVFLNQ